MQFPLMQSDLVQSQVISRFYGLNRLEKGSNGEFMNMCGLSSDRYPCMSAAKQAALKWTKDVDGNEYTNIQAAIAPKYGEEIKGFTGVADYNFYYNGEEKDFRSSVISHQATDITLVDFNGRIIICAYPYTNSLGETGSQMFYYDYTAAGTGFVLPMETSVSGALTAHSSGDPEKDAIVENWIEGLKDDGIAKFKIGDAVQISGFNVAENNTRAIDSKFETADRNVPISAIVEKTEKVSNVNRLYVQLYNYLGERLVFKKKGNDQSTGGTVKIGIPTMNHICIHNNRLWGTNPNGEYVYASKLGDPFNWNTFQGLSNDSYYAEIGTAGDFVGIVSYRDNLVAFKRDYIHHIYGDKPTNYSIPKQLSDCGCIDIKSAVQIGTALYFLGYNGFYIYQGGQPELISDKLDKTYTWATAATDGQKYIVSCSDGLLVYDTRYGTWHIEQETDAVKGYFRAGKTLYLVTDSKIYEYGGENAGDWTAETIIMNEGIFDYKGLIAVWIRAKLGEGSYIDVKTSEDGGDYVGSFRISKEGLHRHKIPVRHIDGDYYAIKFLGHGDAVILDIEREFAVGGREQR